MVTDRQRLRAPRHDFRGARIVDTAWLKWLETVGLLAWIDKAYVVGRKLLATGLETEFLNHYGPIIIDPTFVNNDNNNNFWDFSDADVDWTSNQGINGPAITINCDGVDHSCGAYNGAGAWKYTPAREGDKIIIECKSYKNSSFDGSAYFVVGELDHEKNAGTYNLLDIEPSTHSAWETIIKEKALQDTDCRWIIVYFFITGGTAGAIKFDSIQAWIEPENNFRHSSDPSKVDSSIIKGGYIPLDTAIAAAAAPNNSIYRSSSDNKLYWKDNGGTSNALY